MQSGGFLERSGFVPRVILPVLLIAVLMAVAYSNTLQVPFLFDDLSNLVSNQSLHIDKITPENLLTAATSSPSSNRWLPNISFAFNYYFADHGEVWGFHLVNLAIHLAVSCVFFILAVTTLTLPIFNNRYLRAREIALVATILWALHPVQINAVTYIVQRMTSLSALFFLASVLLYVQGRLRAKSRRRVYFFAASLCCWGLAVISKENAVMLPVMIVGYEIFLLSESSFKCNWQKKVLAVGMAVSIVLLFAVAYFGWDLFASLLAGYRVREFTLGERLLTESRVLFFYLSLLVVPLPSRLNLCHDIVLSRSLFSPPQTALALFSLLAVVVLAAYLFRRDRLASFAIFWFFGNLLIESTVVPLELIFEHRLYLPSTVLFLAVVAAGYRFSSQRLVLRRLLIVVLVVASVFFTWQRNKDWVNERVFWEDVVAKSPRLTRGYHNLSQVFLNDGQYKKAELLLLQGLEVGRQRNGTSRPGSYAALNRAKALASLGTIYWKTGRWRESFAKAELALKVDPDNTMAMVTKGICFEHSGQSGKAVAMYVAANVRGDQSVDLFNNWGVSCFSLGRIDQAINLFQRSLAIDPEHAESHYNLGIAYGSQGMRAEAQREMTLAMQLQQKQRQRQR